MKTYIFPETFLETLIVAALVLAGLAALILAGMLVRDVIKKQVW
jgi:hypothetical protein